MTPTWLHDVDLCGIEFAQFRNSRRATLRSRRKGARPVVHDVPAQLTSTRTSPCTVANQFISRASQIPYHADQQPHTPLDLIRLDSLCRRSVDLFRNRQSLRVLGAALCRDAKIGASSIGF